MTISESIDLLWSFCAQIEEEWKKQDYNVEAFPYIVEDLDAYHRCDLQAFSNLRFLRQCLDIPKVSEIQRLSSFSDVYYRLFDNGKFWVEVLNWWGSDINIHDHDFSAVQYQLKGSALNVEYEFSPLGKPKEGVVVGDYSIRNAALWRPGRHSIVRPGRIAPHNICHIDRPTVSLLIRTHPHAEFGPQWNYFPPGVASSYGVADAVFRKNIKSLRLLAAHDEVSFREAVADFARERPASQRLFAAIKMVDILFDEKFSEELFRLLEDDENLIKSVSYFRVMEEIKFFKNVADLSFDETVALSVVGTAYDADSLEDVCHSIFGKAAEHSVLPNLVTALGRVAQQERLRIARVLALYGLDVLELENAA